MRGIWVVLVLACLVSSALAASCTYGTASTDGTGCICKSGYTTGANGQLCNTTFLADNGCKSKDLSQTEASWFPNLDATSGATSFTGNTLRARIVGNYVAPRTYTEVTFQPSADMLAANVPVANACKAGYVPSYWAQDADKGSCNDTFSLTLPWRNHRDCGFANNTAKTDSEYLYITGYLYVRYVDSLGEVDSFPLTRSTKVPYSVTVKFQRHVTVLLQALNVTSDVKYGMALTEDVYDPDTGILSLEITSIVNWPNMFYTGEALIFYKPIQVLPQTQGSTKGDLCTAANSMCTDGTTGVPLVVFPMPIGNDCPNNVEKSLCTQKLSIKAKLDQTATGVNTHGTPFNCSYDGRYDITAPLYTCRPDDANNKPDCTKADLNITYFIDESDVCGEIGVQPHVDGKLFAFDPSITSGFSNLINTQAITNFQLGKYGNFYAHINSDDNTVALTFRDISFQQQGTSTWTQLMSSTGWRNTLTDNGTYVENYPKIPAMNVHSVFPEAKYFQVYFHSSVFKVQPNSQVIYTFRATIDLSFKGNDHFLQPTELRKRTIETTWEQSVTNAETNVFMRNTATVATPANEVAAPSEGVSSVTFIASVVGAVAGTMIIVFVVVGFALRARSQSKDEPSSSLIAASAAAAQVANRA